jgi:hypothetical protein
MARNMHSVFLSKYNQSMMLHEVLAEASHDFEALLVNIHESQADNRQAVLEPDQLFNNFRGIAASSANDCNFHGYFNYR